jgi:hypothetical protein
VNKKEGKKGKGILYMFTGNVWVLVIQYNIGPHCFIGSSNVREVQVFDGHLDVIGQ